MSLTFQQSEGSRVWDANASRSEPPSYNRNLVKFLNLGFQVNEFYYSATRDHVFIDLKLDRYAYYKKRWQTEILHSLVQHPHSIILQDSTIVGESIWEIQLV